LDALEKATVKPELLITDFVMKAMSGIDLIERCKSLAPELRTILYSGSLREGESRGRADAMLSKPFLPKELIQTVKAVLAA
jgi:CheY-like chemotaxis protein